ncbi:hypothetical protein Gotri_011660 [Gossypium trilobum]|uniref:RNase H type-1 domain-containing protein n=1 Tax=Gossypium trilobum TaxID=34281 RepID=A0A7J9EUH5_9ROSI|nr:hypothetical protein [Gossypium trilobum]
MGFGEVIVERDSMIVIKKLQSPKNDRSLIGVIINEIKEKNPEDLGALSFITYRVEQTKRRTGGCMGERMLLPNLMDGRNSTGDLRGTQRLEELGEENDPRTLPEEYQFPRKGTFGVAIIKKKGKGHSALQ